jgi:hypothetical protein
MEKVHRDCSIRLIIGLVINLAMLEPVFETLGTGDFSMAHGLNLQIALSWRLQFRCRGSRHKSAVAQLSTLGHL